MSDQPAALSHWHAVVESKNPALLHDLLADEVVFRSPAVFAPQEGKALTSSYLSAALKVLGPSLRYVSQWHDNASAVLEFEADLDGVYVQGVDILRWNAEGPLLLPYRCSMALWDGRWRWLPNSVDARPWPAYS
jgi:hypothetical protein